MILRMGAKRRHHETNARSLCRVRSPHLGVTLSEVLMAILVAGIGLVAVITLFPIAVLRSVHATQLTNATILRFNAESVIDVLPQIVHDPDGIDDPNRPGERYIEHFNQRFVVDPVGWWLMGSEHPNLKDWFGNDGANPMTDPQRRLRRYSGGTPSENEARRLVTLPDSWILQWEGTPASEDLTGITGSAPWVTLPGTFDSSALPGTESRVVLFDLANGRSGQVRRITNIQGPRLDLEQPVHGFQGVERVRVETREHRYTWLLTVRTNGFGDAAIDVVVFFRRPFSPEDEHVYDATFLAGQNEALIRFSCTRRNGQTTPLPEPFVKEGGFVFDVTNARWYRVVAVDKPGNAYDLRLTLERPAFETAGNDTNPEDAFIGDEEFGGAMFMRGVVEVFPLGRRRLPRELFEQLFVGP